MDALTVPNLNTVKFREGFDAVSAGIAPPTRCRCCGKKPWDCRRTRSVAKHGEAVALPKAVHVASGGFDAVVAE
jgi:hypothetical protein